MILKINHPKLGGDVVDLRKPLPQRKPNKVMKAEELLAKGMGIKKKPVKGWENIQ